MTDGGGALILGCGRVRPRLPAKLAPCVSRGPVYLIGTGTDTGETPVTIARYLGLTPK